MLVQQRLSFQKSIANNSRKDNSLIAFKSPRQEVRVYIMDGDEQKVRYVGHARR